MGLSFLWPMDIDPSGPSIQARGMCFCKTVGTFVFLPWDLNEFDFKVADPIFHFFQVFLHSLISALVVAVDLARYYLGIVMYDHIFSTCCFREV